MDCPRIPRKGEISEPSAVMQSIWLPHISSNENFFRKFVKKNWKKSWKFKNCEQPVQFPTGIFTQKSCVYLSGIHSDQYQYKIIYESQVMTILVKMWIYLHLKSVTSWNFQNRIFYP